MATVLTAPGTSVSGDANVPAETRVDHLIDAYRQPAFNLAYRLVRRPEDAADAVQDAFLLAMRATRGSSAAPREPSRFGSWLLKIVANVALAQLRRRKIATSVSLDALGSDLADGHADQPLTAVVQREQRGDVLQALLALPDAQRAALTLREYQGLSYDEIGELLDLDRAAIAALLYRARAGFRAAYEGVAASPKSAGCARLAPLISAMLDAELDLGTWKRVDQHVADCRRCRRELKQLRRGRRLHAIIPILTPPASLSTASALGAGGATGTAGVVGIMTKSSVVSGLIGRAVELARPLAGGHLLNAAATLPGASDGGFVAVVERGIGRVTGLATTAGLVFALAAGSPAHHRIPEPATLSAPAGGDRVTSAGPAAPRVLLASGASHGQGIRSAEPPASALAPAASEQAMLAARPAAVSEIAPAAPTEITVASVDGRDAAPAMVGSGETPAGTSPAASESGSSSVPPPSVAQAAGPGVGGAAVGAPPAADPPSNEPPAGSFGAGGPGEPSAGGSSGPGASSGSSASIDLAAIDLPSIELAAAVPALDLPALDLPVSSVPPVDLPAVDLPAVDLPAVDLPAVEVPSADLSTVAAGRVDLPPVELPAVDLPPVDLPAVSLPVANRASLNLPAVDPPAVDLPPVDLPPVELPLAVEPLDRVRGVAGQALAEGGRVSKPLAELADRVEQAIPDNVLAVPDVSRAPAHNGAGQRGSGEHGTSPGIGIGSPGVNVSSGNPAEPGAPVSVSVSSGASGNGQTSSGPVEVSATAGAGAANSLQSDSPSLTVHAGVDANGAGASDNGATSLVESSGNLDAGVSGLNASIDIGSNSSGSIGSNSSSSVSISVDTGSNSGSNSNDSGSSGASVSVSASVDTGSVSSSNNDSNSTSNSSVSVSVSIDTSASSSSSNESSSTGASVNVSVGSVSVGVSVP